MLHLLFNYRIILSFITYQPKSKPTPQITSSPNFDSEIIQGKKQTPKIADIFEMSDASEKRTVKPVLQKQDEDWIIIEEEVTTVEVSETPEEAEIIDIDLGVMDLEEAGSEMNTIYIVLGILIVGVIICKF